MNWLCRAPPGRRRERRFPRSGRPRLRPAPPPRGSTPEHPRPILRLRTPRPRPLLARSCVSRKWRPRGAPREAVPLPVPPPPPSSSSWAGRAAGTTGRPDCRRAPRSRRPPPRRWSCRWSWEVRRDPAPRPWRGSARLSSSSALCSLRGC